MKNFIIYQGPSVLDGAPIVVVATLNSSNPKTAGMVQTWIIRSDITPVEASKSGADSSVCGNCPLRQGIGGACYVNLGQAPRAVYNAFQKGRYATLSPQEVKEALAYKVVRLGSYGDPAAVPASVWTNALELSRSVTGYTHQAKHKNFDSAILKWCMVSAETAKQAKEYHAEGLRTFRLVTQDAPKFDNEIECPSDKGVSCIECKACDGAMNNTPSVTIMVHGSRTRKHTEKYGNANLIAVAN